MAMTPEREVLISHLQQVASTHCSDVEKAKISWILAAPSERIEEVLLDSEDHLSACLADTSTVLLNACLYQEGLD